MARQCAVLACGGVGVMGEDGERESKEGKEIEGEIREDSNSSTPIKKS